MKLSTTELFMLVMQCADRLRKEGIKPEYDLEYNQGMGELLGNVLCGDTGRANIDQSFANAVEALLFVFCGGANMRFAYEIEGWGYKSLFDFEGETECPGTQIRPAGIIPVIDVPKFAARYKKQKFDEYSSPFRGAARVLWHYGYRSQIQILLNPRLTAQAKAANRELGIRISSLW